MEGLLGMEHFCRKKKEILIRDAVSLQVWFLQIRPQTINLLILFPKCHPFISTLVVIHQVFIPKFNHVLADTVFMSVGRRHEEDFSSYECSQPFQLQLEKSLILYLRFHRSKYPYYNLLIRQVIMPKLTSPFWLTPCLCRSVEDYDFEVKV